MGTYTGGWTADDFTDTLSPEPKEDDPWAVQLPHGETVPDSPNRDPDAKTEMWTSGQTELLESDFTDSGDFDGSETSEQDNRQLDAPWSLDGESYQEWKILSIWDEEQPSSARSAETDTPSDVEVNNSSLDEPDPQAEYDSELGRPLYEPAHDISNLSRAVKVNQWVASIDEASDAQLQEITKLLMGFSEAVLRSWLRWLREHEWTGHSLLLFFQFRTFWNETPKWWEAAFWDSRFGCWRPTWNRHNLSRDDQFDLVQHRIDCHPNQVISSTWFDDWERFALWECGYDSFADFALFRAGLMNREDWRNHVDWYRASDLVKDSPRAEDTRPNHSPTPQSHHTPRRTFWFANQDWYNPVEWHDGLGW